MNKRALLLTAATTALLSGQALGAPNPNPPCSTTTSLPDASSPTATQLCDITTAVAVPLSTGAANPSLTTTTGYSGLGNFTIDTDGSLTITANPPQAPAITINSGTLAAPTTVTNNTTIAYTGINYAVGVLMEEASVPTSSSAYGTAENNVGEFVNLTGTINMTGAGIDKNGILFAGGSYYVLNSTSGVTDPSTGTYPNFAATTDLGVFTGIIPSGAVAGTNPVAINLFTGSTLEVQGTNSYGINLIGPTYSLGSPSEPSGGATLIGDIDVSGSIVMTPVTVGSTTAQQQNIAINIAGWQQNNTTPNTPNPALSTANDPALTAATEYIIYPGAIEPYLNGAYAMVGNIDVAAGGSVTSEGQGAEGIVVTGAVDGAIINSGTIATTGTSTSSTATNAVDPEGGSALIVANNITGGIYNDGPTLASGGQNTAPASISTTGSITNGGGPTILISPSGNTNGNTFGYYTPIKIGTYADLDYGGQFSLVNRGSITSLPEDANNSAMTIDLSGSVNDGVTLVGGIFNSGTISSTAATNTLTSTDSVTATALNIASYVTVGTGSGASGGNYNLINTNLVINNNTAEGGSITASVSGPDTGTATAIFIGQYSKLPSIFNAGSISASAISTNLTIGGTPSNVLNAYAIIDQSGTLTNINNQGTISASVSTLDNNTGPSDPYNEAVAIDLSANLTTAVTINDQGTTNGSALIDGSIYFGSHQGTLTVSGTPSDAANVIGNITFNNACASITCTGTDINDTLSIGAFSTVTGQITESTTGSVDISVASTGKLNLLTTAPTNLNSTVSVPVSAGVPVHVGALSVGSGGTLDENLSQGYNVLVYSGSNVINAQSASIGDPSGTLHPLLATFGSFVGTPGGGASEFVLVNSATPIKISNLELEDLTSLYAGSATMANGIPYLFSSSICAFDIYNTTTSASVANTCSSGSAPSLTTSSIVLTLTPKTASQLGLTGYALKMFNYVNQALVYDNTLGATMINDIKTGPDAQAAYASFTPDVSGATRATAISLTDSSTGIVAARQRELRMYAGQEGDTTLWGQQFGERLSVNNANSLTGYNDSGYGFVMGLDEGDPADGRYGGAFTFFAGGMSDKEPTSSKTASEYELATFYTDWRGKGFFVDTQATAGYGNLKGKRYLTLGAGTNDVLYREADSQRPTEMLAGSVTTGVILNTGGTVFMPQFSVDGLTMREEGYTESNGGEGFDLHVNPYYAESLRAFLGADVRQDVNFGSFYIQPELRAGYRYDFIDGAVKLKANFASVGPANLVAANPFTIEGPDPGHGNLVFGGGIATTTGAWSIGIDYDYVRGNGGEAEQTGVLTLLGRI